MKLKSALLVISGLLVGSLASQAATVALANVTGGPGVDTIWAGLPSTPIGTDALPLNGTGFVAVGYFASSVLVTDIDTIPELLANLGTFTTLQSAVVGNSVNFASPGYLLEDQASFSPTGIVGRPLYTIATDAASLGAATGTSGFSLFQVATIQEDVPFPNDYVANPTGVTPVIGTLGSWTGTTLFGEGTYTTLQLAQNVIPEPSAALLGAFGVLGLLRRRRI